MYDAGYAAGLMQGANDFRVCINRAGYDRFTDREYQAGYDAGYAVGYAKGRVA